MLDKAIEALKTYDWGQDKKVLAPIDEAIVASHGDDAKRGELEASLTAVLKTEAPLDGKQMICRYLRTIGTAACVPTLAGLLSDEKVAHMARYALERIPAPEAAAAMRDSLKTLKGSLQVGVISSLGVRQDEESVTALSELTSNADPAVANAAVQALGAIRTQKAASALAGAKGPEVQSAVADASFACAESLLAEGKNADALVIYKRFVASKAKHVRLAATRGVLACAKK